MNTFGSRSSDPSRAIFAHNNLVSFSTRLWRARLTLPYLKQVQYWPVFFISMVCQSVHAQYGLKGQRPVSRRCLEPKRFYGDPAPLARHNIYGARSPKRNQNSPKSSQNSQVHHCKCQKNLCHKRTAKGFTCTCLTIYFQAGWYHPCLYGPDLKTTYYDSNNNNVSKAENSSVKYNRGHIDIGPISSLHFSEPLSGKPLDARVSAAHKGLLDYNNVIELPRVPFTLGQDICLWSDTICNALRLQILKQLTAPGLQPGLWTWGWLIKNIYWGKCLIITVKFYLVYPVQIW